MLQPWLAATNVAALSGALGDPHIASVVLLLGFEGADGSTTLTDESTATNKGAGTAVGNAQIDTAQFAFGASSGLFDGTGDWWTWADHADWRLSTANSDQFTIEFFCRRLAGATGRQYVIGQADASGTWAWDVNLRVSTGLVEFNWSSDGSTNQQLSIGTVTFNVDTWYYVAISKNSSGKIRIHYGPVGSPAVMVGSSTPADSSMFNSSATLTLGRAKNSTAWNGWIDEVRITKGVCRYDTDADITIPTAAFPRT